jgi:excisionase family DNA binding protein
MAATLISLRRLHSEHLPDVSERWLYDLARRGEIPSVRLGSRWLFDPDAVIASLKARERGGVVGPTEPARPGKPNIVPGAAVAPSDAKE